MHTEYYREYSPSLGRDMEYKVYGLAGKPMLVFPCQEIGRASCRERV